MSHVFICKCKNSQSPGNINIRPEKQKEDEHDSKIN